MSKYRDLDESITRNCGEDSILLHQKENGDCFRVLDGGEEVKARNYTLQELITVRCRPFASRLYITDLNVYYTTVWRRNRFTDNAYYENSLRKVRDFVKNSDEDHSIAAKAVIADILTSWFEMESSDYESLACLLASGLSGTNVSFEVKSPDTKFGLLRCKEDAEKMRRKMAAMMKILFDKLSLDAFLVKGGGSNIYRLTHCMTKHKRGTSNDGRLSSLTSATIQLVLTGYVILECINKFTLENWKKMILLTILTTVLSILIIMPTYKFGIVYKFYIHGGGWRRNPLAYVDFFTNFVLPVILVVAGAVVIIIQDNYMDAVLNSAALLFIIDIDELLPTVLELDTVDIVRNYLIKESIQDFNELELDENELPPQQPIEFSDIDLTNTPECGTNVENCRIFHPFSLTASYGNMEFSPSAFITSDCLISRLEFCYTTGFPRTTAPRIGYLKATMLESNKSYTYNPGNHDYANHRKVIVDPHQKTKEAYPKELAALMEKYESVTTANSAEVDKELDKLQPVYILQGVYMITTCELSESIYRLRVVGSKTPRMFARAIDNYRLWDIDDQAQRLLMKEKKAETMRASQLKTEADPLVNDTENTAGYHAAA